MELFPVEARNVVCNLLFLKRPRSGERGKGKELYDSVITALATFKVVMGYFRRLIHDERSVDLETSSFLSQP